MIMQKEYLSIRNFNYIESLLRDFKDLYTSFYNKYTSCSYLSMAFLFFPHVYWYQNFQNSASSM